MRNERNIPDTESARPRSSACGAFGAEHSADSRGIGWQIECAPTLRGGVIPAVVIYEADEDN